MGCNTGSDPMDRFNATIHASPRLDGPGRNISTTVRADDGLARNPRAAVRACLCAVDDHDQQEDRCSCYQRNSEEKANRVGHDLTFYIQRCVVVGLCRSKLVSQNAPDDIRRRPLNLGRLYLCRPFHVGDRSRNLGKPIHRSSSERICVNNFFVAG
jgi:hypothetical protein